MDRTFLHDNSDKIIVLKFFAPWCSACQRLEPKYAKISKSKKYEDIPILFAQISYEHNEEFVSRQGIKAIPSMQIYVAEKVVENFICGPKHIDILKEKIDDTIKNSIIAHEEVLRTSMHTSLEAAWGIFVFIVGTWHIIEHNSRQYN